MDGALVRQSLTTWGRTIRKVMGGGGWGIFSLYEFFFSRAACAGFFFLGETPCTNFFLKTNIAFFNSEILIHYLCFCETIELRKQHIKNLSDTQLTAEQINLLSRGLKFIPTPVMKENQISRQLISDFNRFARRMRLQYIYHDQNTEQHPFHVKSSWIPPIQRSVALETYLKEVNSKACGTPLVKPKNNLPPGEERALKELINNKEIILKKEDEGTTTVVMNRENEITEGQIQLDDRNNYQPLDKPMVGDTFQRVKHLINSLRQAGCIDEMTAK